MADKNSSGTALEKRQKIKSVKQMMMMIVLVASLSVGICVVLAIRSVKYIGFYGTVIGKKDLAVADYEKTITNIGLCAKPKDEHYTLEEIKKCNPNTYTAPAGSLRYTITNDLAYNEDLESVARESDVDFCYDDNGDKIDYQSLLGTVSQDEEMYAHYLGMLKICSSLRVIPDALPASENVEALLASLNQIFVESGWEPESLSPAGGGSHNTTITEVGTIPVSLSVESDALTTMSVLHNIEKSIRVFDVSTATIEWSGDNRITLQAQADAYYAKGAGISESTVTEYATKQKKK